MLYKIILLTDEKRKIINMDLKLTKPMISRNKKHELSIKVPYKYFEIKKIIHGTKVHNFSRYFVFYMPFKIECLFFNCYVFFNQEGCVKVGESL